MQIPRVLTILGLGGHLVLSACASQAKDDQSGSASGATTATPNVFGTGSTGSTGATGNGGSGGLGSGTTPVSPTGQVAQDTPDGLATITADQAAKLKDPKAACSGWAEEPESTGQPPILEFVIDVTGSMADQPAYPTQANSPSKWTEMQRVLPTAFQSLPTNWITGVAFYRKPDNGCYQPDQPVAIDLMSTTQLTAIEAAIARRGPKGNTTAGDNVQGATPTYAAWKNGLDTLTAYQAPAGYESSNRYIVLITDGVPTVNADGCTYVNPIVEAEYDTEIAAVTQEGNARGVKTFVVGVLGSEQAQNATYDPLYMLSKLAIAGRTEEPAGCAPVSGTLNADRTALAQRGSYCHHDLSQSTNFGADLVGTLGDITASLISCTYTLAAPPAGQKVDPNKTVIVYSDGSGNDSVVLPNTSANCDKGWHFTDSSQQTLEICSQTCAILQSNSKASLNVIFGCAVSDVIGPIQ